MPDQDHRRTGDPATASNADVIVPDHGETSYRGAGRLAGTRALVTGGACGIGRAISLAFAREGAEVAVVALPTEEDAAAQTAELLRAEGGRCVVIDADLQHRNSCHEAVDRAVAELGGLDVLVNHAGYRFAQGRVCLDELTEDQVDRVLRSNLHSVIWVTQAALRYLGPGTSIICTSRTQAYDQAPALLDHAAAKAGVNSLVVLLAAQLGPRGIRVNAVAPGPVLTAGHPSTEPGTRVEDVPLGRFAQPAEVAPAYVFLACERESSYVSGTVVGVTGGRPVL